MALSGHRTGYLNGTTSGWVARSVFWYGSNWYLVALDTSAVKIRVYKSPDGLTWTEQDASNALSHSGATDSYDVGMPLSGTSAGKLHIAYRTATNTVRVQIFDMATDTFAGTDVGGANASTVVAADFGMSVAVRSDGDVLVLMRNNSNSDIYVLRYEGSSWASTTINTTNTSIPLDLCMTGNSDMAHILWYENVSFDWTTRSISNANALGTVTDIDSSVMTTPIFGSTMGYVNDGGTHRLIAPVPDSDGGLDISYAVSATTPTWTKINSVSPTTVTDPGIMGTVIVPYNSSFHALWSGDGRGEIHYDFSDDYATPAWRTDQTPVSGLGNNPAVSAAAGSTGVLAAYTDLSGPTVDTAWIAGGPAAASYQGALGTVSYSGASVTSQALTLTSAVPSGDTIILYGVCTGVRGVTSITDTGGNTWGTAVVTSGSLETAMVAYCHVTTALTTSDSITLTWDAATSIILMDAEWFSGLDTASGWDITDTGNGSSTDSRITVGATTTADQLLVVTTGLDSGVSPQPGPLTTPLAPTTNTRVLLPGYRSLSATGSFDMGWMHWASQDWATVAGTLKVATGGGSAALSASIAGTSSATATAINLPRALSASIAGTSSATATRLSLEHALTATIAGTSTATADRLTLAHPLTASVVGTSSATATQITELHALSAIVTGTSTATATGLRLNHVLTASAVGTSSVTADLSVSPSGPVLAASIVGTSSATATRLTLNHPLTASVAGTSTASATRLTEPHALSASISGTSSASADLTVPTAGAALTASIVGTSTATASRLALPHALSGSIQGTSSAVATAIQLQHALTAMVTGSSTATATRLSLAHALTASAIGTSTATATRLTMAHALTALISGTSDASAHLQITALLSASITGTSSVSADLTVSYGLLPHLTAAITDTGLTAIIADTGLTATVTESRLTGTITDTRLTGTIATVRIFGTVDED